MSHNASTLVLYATELVRDSTCLPYNCEFAERAIRLGLKLATMDGKLLKAFPKQARSLTSV
ncbi:MAG: hypothetical protein ABI564_18685 [Ideonella sp.]